MDLNSTNNVLAFSCFEDIFNTPKDGWDIENIVIIQDEDEFQFDSWIELMDYVESNSPEQIHVLNNDEFEPLVPYNSAININQFLVEQMQFARRILSNLDFF